MGEIAEPVDILVAFNDEIIAVYQKELTGGGVVILDDERIKGIGGDDGPYS